MNQILLTQIRQYKNSGASVVHSFTHIESDNTIEVVYRWNDGTMYATNPPRPSNDIVWKEVYGVSVAGKLVLIDVKMGKHTPQTTIAEKITFDDKNP